MLKANDRVFSNADGTRGTVKDRDSIGYCRVVWDGKTGLGLLAVPERRLTKITPVMVQESLFEVAGQVARSANGMRIDWVHDPKVDDTEFSVEFMKDTLPIGVVTMRKSPAFPTEWVFETRTSAYPMAKEWLPAFHRAVALITREVIR